MKIQFLSRRSAQSSLTAEKINSRLPGGYQAPPFGAPQFLAMMIVCVALWVVSLVWLGIQALEQWSGSWSQEIKYHIYLPQNQQADGEEMVSRLAALASIRAVRNIPQQEQAEWVLGWLGGDEAKVAPLLNKLPLTIEVTPQSNAVTEVYPLIKAEAERYGAELNENEVGLAKSSVWLSRIHLFVLFGSLAVALAMAVIISNTLRMTMLSRAEEVNVMRLLGAPESFVRMPFVIEGVIVGGGAGIIAWLLLWPMLWIIREPMTAFNVQLNGWTLLLPLLIGGSLVGAAAALIATWSLEAQDVEASQA